MIADPITHYVLDAIILILAIVRYLWGSLTNLTRLGIVMCFLELNLANFDSYHMLLRPEISPGGPAGRILGKTLLAVFIVADLVREYVLDDYEDNLGAWAGRGRKKAR